MTVAEWALKRRWLNNTGGGYQMDVEVGGGVPEPSTLLLGVSSLAAFAFLRRRAAK